MKIFWLRSKCCSSRAPPAATVKVCASLLEAVLPSDSATVMSYGTLLRMVSGGWKDSTYSGRVARIELLLRVACNTIGRLTHGLQIYGQIYATQADPDNVCINLIPEDLAVLKRLSGK